MDHGSLQEMLLAVDETGKLYPLFFDAAREYYACVVRIGAAQDANGSLSLLERESVSRYEDLVSVIHLINEKQRMHGLPPLPTETREVGELVTREIASPARAEVSRD